MLGDISYHKGTLQSEGKHSIHFTSLSVQKLLTEATNLSEHIYILAGSFIRDTISKYQHGMAKVARKTFDIGEV